MNSGGTLAICEETFPNDNSSYVQCMDSGSTDAICAGMTSGNNSSTGSTATCGGTSYPPDGNTYTCQNGYWDEVSSASQNSSDNTGSYTQDNTDTSQPSDSGGSSCTEQYDADGNDLGCF
jgi:hypothetical protein